MKKAKQRVALQKNPTPKKSTSAGLAGSTPTKPPPAKKRKQSEPKCIPVNGMAERGSLSETTQVGLETQMLVAAPVGIGDGTNSQHTIQAINLSTTLHQGIVKASGSDAMELGETQAAQPPKEPPILSDKLPLAVLAKVTNLEQVHNYRVTGCYQISDR